MCTCNKEHLKRELFVYVLNSCGLVKVVKKNNCQISRTQEQIKPAKKNLSRKSCSSVRGFIVVVLGYYYILNDRDINTSILMVYILYYSF